MPPQSPSILFCGKYPVSFVMFEPVYQALRGRQDIWLGVSTGRYRRRLGAWVGPRDPAFLNESVFAGFDVDPRHLVETSCHDPHPYDVYVSANLNERMQPPNSRMKVQIYHGVSFRNMAVNPEYASFDKLFFPGRYMMEQYIQRGILSEGDPRIELMGMPKVDRLMNGTLNRERILRDLGLDPALPTVLWCPTGQVGNGYELLGHEGLNAIQSLDCNLIVKLHDHPHLRAGVTRESLAAHVRAGLGERGRLYGHSDAAPAMFAADALVSDASSIIFEYCLLDRPIVLIDVPEMLRRRSADTDNAMDLDSHGRKVGVVVSSAGELRAALQNELASPQRLSAERRAAAAHIFHEPGTATARMARRLCELAGASLSAQVA